MSLGSLILSLVSYIMPSDVLCIIQFGPTARNYFVIPLLREQMFKRFALGLAIAIIILGIIFIGLDILDIAEDYRLYLPIAILNTVFICAVAILVAYIAAKNFIISGSLEVLGIGCALLAFGGGSLLYGWLGDAGLNTRITANYSGVLIASAMHLFGAGLGMAKRHLIKSEPKLKQRIIFLSYLGILVIIAFVTWLAFRGVLPSFIIPLIDTIEVRDVIQGVAAILCFASALIYLRIYFSSRSDFHYWYSLGLILFAFGVIFISLGAVESRIAWLGRASQYAAGSYFLVSVLGSYRRAGVRGV